MVHPTVELRYFNSSLHYEVLCQFLEFSWQLGWMIQNKTYDEEMIKYYYRRYRDSGKVSKERQAILQKLYR